MSKLLVSIEIRCGEFEFDRKDVIDVPKGLPEESAILLHYSQDATDIDGDTYYYCGCCYCYTVKNWKKLTPEQARVLDELGVK